MAKQFNHHHGAKWKEFQIGDTVYFQLHSANKKWSWTPGTVVQKVGSVNYMVQVDLPNNQRIIKVHANQLKLRHVRNEIAIFSKLQNGPSS